MGCFRDERLPSLRENPLQQIWRDHLLAGSMRAVDDYADGFFVFLYPSDNEHCAAAIGDYDACLRDGDDSFVPWTLEEVVGVIRRHTDDRWIDLVWERYLDFERVEALLGG